jgi:hypothetical protein
MNLKIIEEKYNGRFVFKNTYFCEKTLFPIFTFIDTYDETEYRIESSNNVQLEVVLKNIIVEKRNKKITNIFK